MGYNKCMDLTRSFVADTGFSLNIPDNFNFAYDVVDVYAQKNPQKLALLWCNDDGDEKQFTFEQLSELSQQIAVWFTELGITKGKSVMLFLGRRWEYWPVVLALHRIGAIGIPCTDHLHKKDIEYRLNSLSVSMIVCGTDTQILEETESCVKAYSGAKPILVNVCGKKSGWNNLADGISAASKNFPRPNGTLAAKNDDTMLLYFTSGTSGNPKMVKHDFTYPLSHIFTAKNWHQVTDGGIHYTSAETGWAKASWGQIYGQWICGSAVFVYDTKGFHPDKLLGKLAKYRVTSFCATPTIYRYLLRQNFSKYDLSCVKHCTAAGETLSADFYHEFLQKTGLEIHEGYGQTETTLLAGNFAGMKVKPGSMGKPSPCYKIDIVDKDGNTCAPGVTGELVIDLRQKRPCGLFTGYFNNEKLTQEVFKDGIYHTQDTVYRDNDGYLWFAGRKDDIIKSAGFRISPFEVENVLNQHPAVLECAVTGVKDSERGQAVKATVVLAPGYSAGKNMQNELIAFVKNETASYKCPRIIDFVEELPKTLNGKIRREELREKSE